MLAAGCLPACLSTSASDTRTNAFVQKTLVTNRPELALGALVDRHMVNPWGIALRPPGAGGHIWISNAGNLSTSTYIGDVKGSPLRQDGLKIVYLDGPLISYQDGLANVTGQVYNAASDFPGQPLEFPVSGPASNLSSGTPVPIGTVSGAAKFVFVTTDGTINAWRASTAESMDRAVIVKDYSDHGRDQIKGPQDFCPLSPASRCRPASRSATGCTSRTFRTTRSACSTISGATSPRASRSACPVGFRPTSALTTSSSWTDGSTWRSRRSTRDAEEPATDVPAPGAGPCRRLQSRRPPRERDEPTPAG